MEIQIKVFGLTAKEIQPGDIFTPVFDSEEGHDVVTLIKNNAINKLLDLIDSGAIGLDQIVGYLKNLSEATDQK